MSYQMVQGRTFNWLTWCFCDATDFATRESALSAATKVKIYGRLESTSLVYFVSSGTGSMAGCDVKHVGASVNGVYTIGLVKADLSDASAAWYDEYTIVLSATGAAMETFICEGVRTDTSYMSNVLSHLSAVSSDVYSALVVMQSRVLVVKSDTSTINAVTSDILSTLGSQFAVVSNYLSNASNFQSDILSTMGSQYSDLASKIGAIELSSDAISNIASATAGAVGAAIASQVWAAKYTAHSAASSFGSLMSDLYSRLRLTQSDASDIRSMLLIMSDVLSDFYSDFQSRVPKAVATNSQLSDLHSDLRSYLVAMSDVLSDFYSDFQSRVPKAVATNSQLSDLHSDLKSYLVAMSAVDSNAYSLLVALSDALSDAHSDLASKIGAVAATIDASAASDVASAVWAHTIGARVDSRLLVVKSDTSTINATLSDLKSDFQSRVPKAVATNSQLSDLASDLKSYLAAMSGVQSDIYSLLNAGLTTTTADKQAAADEFLNRDLAGSGSGNTRRVQNALRGLRNKTAIAAGVLTVYAEDDATVAWSAAVSTAAGNPIVLIDP